METKNAPPPLKPPSWKKRRRRLDLVLLYCGGILGVLAYLGGNSPVRETIAIGIIAVVVAVVPAYLLGAAWDDKNVMAAMSKRPASPDLGAGEY